MRGVKAQQKKTATPDDTVQLVTFQVGAEEYGLDIRFITEVVRPLRITSLPRMPQFIEGVVSLRGVIIPVVDLRKRFALPPPAEQSKKMRMVITKGAVPAPSGEGRDLLGLIVDSVQEVIHVPLKDIGRAPEAAMGKHAEFLSGMGKVGDQLIILLDITKILNQQERSELAEAGNAGY
jgi:purine-binding chemotaxis protein CheW